MMTATTIRASAASLIHCTCTDPEFSPSGVGSIPCSIFQGTKPLLGTNTKLMHVFYDWK